MPNWCQNHLFVVGPPEVLRRFTEKAKGEDSCLSFQGLRPMPEDPEQQLREVKGTPIQDYKEAVLAGMSLRSRTHEEELRDAWYDWHNAFWGTKWDLNETQDATENFESVPATWELNFDTAWGPPVELFDFVAGEFPELRFELEYYELGCWFAGVAVWDGGEKVNHDSGEPEDFEFCGEVLAEIKACEEEDAKAEAEQGEES